MKREGAAARGARCVAGSYVGVAGARGALRDSDVFADCQHRESSMDAVLGDLANRLETALPAWVLADMHNTVWLLAAAAALLPPLATYTIWILIKSLLPPMPPRRLQTIHPGNCCITCSTGGYEALQVRALPADTATQGAVPEGHTPLPPEDLVTVRVQAAGVNYADICIRWGLYASWNKFGGGTGTCTTTSRDCSINSEASAIQNVPGFEFAGIVEAIGSSVTNVKVGDEIFGVTLFGAYTCRLVVPAHQVFRRPRGLKPSQAAALPAVAMTAYFAVMRQASPISPGEPVLIHSGAGGVGSMLIQMCRIQGWRVCAVVGSSHKVSACVELGADCVIDKSTSDLWAQARSFAPRGFAAVFDANGVATLQQSWEHLAPCGKLIVYGFQCVFSFLTQL